METIERFNKALEYIEAHLTLTIDENEIERITLCPSGLFYRMFPILSGITLSDYIRRRKLSLAGLELLKTKKTVTEIALDFGYDSPDAFSFAFKQLHGMSPSAARKGETLMFVPKMTFTMSLKGEMSMKYMILEKEAFTVVGKSIKTTQEDNMKNQTIAKFWQKTNQSTLPKVICEISPNTPFLGVCYGMESDGSFRYLIGVDAKRTVEDLESIEIPKATWAVFESIGPMPEAILHVWKKIYEEFFPSSGYRHAGTPDFESYPEDGSSRKDYRAEVWIPIVKNE
jgi:AraC family transcriptional regulator